MEPRGFAAWRRCRRSADWGTLVRYEGIAKHKQPWQCGRRGSLCPAAIDLETARRLLSNSEAVGAKRYAVHEGRAYCAREHGADAWHGYPVGWREVPENLRRAWRKEGRLRRRDVKKHWNG